MERDTLLLSGIQLGTQGMGLLLNIFLTRRLGGSAVGVVSLISSFFWLCAVLASGNGFVAASRFVSEEIGRGCGNPKRVLRYCGGLCLGLSLMVGGAICIAAPVLAERALRDKSAVLPIYLLAAALPLSSLTACLKGYFHAYRQVLKPALADTLEFLVRSGMLAFCVCFLVPDGRCSILTALAASLLVGQLCGFAVLLWCYRRCAPCGSKCCILWRGYLVAALPILCNSYITALLSTANDALIPLTLRQFGHSSAEALQEFGIFEAILLPALFFPSVVLSCLSCILVPELSRERAAQHPDAVSALITRVMGQTIQFAGFVTLCLLLFGNEIGTLIGGTPFAGRMLRLLAPVVPFIYLEIVLEAILRGMGKQNFSSANYIAEYLIRISVLLVCVPLMGFYGLLLSYYASNVIGNCVRIVMVSRLSDVPVRWRALLIPPLASGVLTWQFTTLLFHIPVLATRSAPAKIMLFVCIGGALYWFLLQTVSAFFAEKKPHRLSVSGAAGR